MLERSDIVWALEQLAVRLGDAGHALSIAVVGGAAIVLEHNPDRGSTNDIDGWISTSRPAHNRQTERSPSERE